MMSSAFVESDLILLVAPSGTTPESAAYKAAALFLCYGAKSLYSVALIEAAAIAVVDSKMLVGM